MGRAFVAVAVVCGLLVASVVVVKLAVAALLSVVALAVVAWGGGEMVEIGKGE